MKARIQLIAIATALLWFTACGAPGNPLPPSLELPRTVQDLTVTRKGDKVYLSWTAPTQTTDGQNIRPKKLGPAQVCRGIGQLPMPYCAQLAGEVPAAQIPITKPGQPPQKVQFTDTLTPQIEAQHPTGFATYAVAMLNWRNRSAGLSNQVQVPLAPALSPPPVGAEVMPPAASPSGSASIVVRFNWQASPPDFRIPGLRYAYRLFRRIEGSTAAVPIAEKEVTSDMVTVGSTLTVPCCSLWDTNFEWEKTYYYHVTPVTIVMQNGQKIAEVEGDDSREIKVFAHDVFPPAKPRGLQAVFSGVGQKPFVDLTWAQNTDADLAGYNLYRRQQGQRPEKINAELVATPSFRDINVAPDRTYYYSVSAVDTRGNESERSEETSERVP